MAAIIEFEGLGENLLSTVKAVTDATIKLRDETSKAGEAVKKSALEGAAAEQRLATTVEGTATALQAVRKEAEKGGAGKLAADADKATKATLQYADSNEKAASAVAKSREEAARLIASTKSLTSSQKEAAAAAGGVSKEYRAILASGKGIENGPAAAAEATKSLRTQLREAKAELDRIIEASDGKITPELIAAGRRAGELSDRFGDLNATVESFNPDTKFRAVIGVVGNLTGGIQAASSAMGLFGAESDEVQKALLKVQQASAFFQGFQSFIGGLADNFKNLRAVIASSALATQADTAAKGANAAGTVAVAGANTAAAGATGAFTTALNGMKAALLSNPITAVAVALLALGTAIYAVMVDTRDYTAALDDLIKRLDEVSQSRFNEIDQRLRLQAIENEREALEAGETDAAKRRQREKDYINERAALVGKQLEREANLVAVISELESLRGKDSDSANQAREKALTKLNEYTEAFKQGTVDLKLLELEQTNATIRESNERKKSYDEANRSRVRSAEAAAAEVAKIEADLKRRVDAAQLEGVDPRQRLDLQREAAIEEVRILERTLQEKLALQRIEAEVGAETFARLSEAQKKARADALIDGGQVELSVAQQEQVTSLELAVWDKYWEERKALDVQERTALLDLQQQGFEREREQFDIELDARVDKLREAGATIVQIEAFIQGERDKFRSGQVLKAITEEEALAMARIDAQVRGAESEAVFRQRIELEKLATSEGFAQQRLAAIEGDTSAEAELLRAQLQGTINEIKAKRAELEANAPRLDLFDLLGIDITEEQKAQLIDDLKSIGASVADLLASGIEARRAALDAEIEINDERISEQQRLRGELQAQLDEALEAEKNGYANNADSLRAQIELTKTAEAEALNEKKRIQAEQAKLARQQILIDSAVQVSALITANARLFEKGALAGIPGIIAAIAASLSLLATFASIKAKIKATSSGAPQFHRGTKYVELGPNPRGRDTIPAYLDEGEAVVSAKNRKRFEPLVNAIVEGDMHKVQEAAIRELLGSSIQLDGDQVTKVVRLKEQYIERTTVVNNADNEKLAKKVDRLTGIVEAFMEQEGSRETTTGNVTKKPGKIIRKR